MSTAKFTTTGFSIDTLMGQIETGQIGLPELQRPFVWDGAQVRDLIDSLYRGLPAGHFLLWETGADAATVPIGTDVKQMTPTLVVVDGQQRLTSLYVVFRGVPVVTKKFAKKKITIAFHPLRERFEVRNSAISNDPEWVSDITPLLNGNSYSFVTQYLESQHEELDLTTKQKDQIAGNLERVANLGMRRFEAVQLSRTLEIEEVSEIFVRVNSKGTQLSQADFILTLMSVHWDQGRKELEKFCRAAAKVPSAEASPYNHIIQPSPDQLLRVSVGLAHDRARLKYAYEILRGKDPKTGEVSQERRVENFDRLKKAQQEVLNLDNFGEYLKALDQAGFLNEKMITSKNLIVFCYLIFLIGRRDYELKTETLQTAIARWFFMGVLTSRYTGSSETQIEKDLRMLSSASTGEEFVGILNGAIATSLTDDYWKVTLPDLLKSAGPRIPAMFAYYASLNLLGAKVLFSNRTVHDLLNPPPTSKMSTIKPRHLFPKDYLKTLAITKPNQINQVANFALGEWPDNITTPPSEYIPRLMAKVPENEREAMCRLHALPQGWEQMEYEDFLKARRPMIAQVIEDAFRKLTHGSDPDQLMPSESSLPIDELVAGGETVNVEFKSSVWHSNNPDVPKKAMEGNIIKTLAAFLNTEGGSLIIGVDDNGHAVGLDPDFKKQNIGRDRFENDVTRIEINAFGEVAASKCRMRFDEYEGQTVAIVEVERSPQPVYANHYKGQGIFFCRIANTTRELSGKELVAYVKDRWGLHLV